MQSPSTQVFFTVQVRSCGWAWLAEQTAQNSNFRGAFFSGSATALPEDSALLAYSDVGVVVIVSGSTTPPVSLVLGGLALAYLRQRQLEAATATLHEAIDLLEDSRGGGGLTVVFSAGRELYPWRSTPAVQDVHDRLLALVARA